jgi:hypothetical protein
MLLTSVGVGTVAMLEMPSTSSRLLLPFVT